MWLFGLAMISPGQQLPPASPQMSLLDLPLPEPAALFSFFWADTGPYRAVILACLTPLLLSPRVRLLIAPPDMLVSEMSINLSGRYIGVA